MCAAIQQDTQGFQGGVISRNGHVIKLVARSSDLCGGSSKDESCNQKGSTEFNGHDYTMAQ